MQVPQSIRAGSSGAKDTCLITGAGAKKVTRIQPLELEVPGNQQPQSAVALVHARSQTVRVPRVRHLELARDQSG